MKKIGVVGLPQKWSSEILADTVEKETGFRLLIDMQRVSVDLNSGKVCYGEIDLTELDALLIKKLGREYSPHLLDRLEILRYLKDKFGVKIFSDPDSIFRLLDRLSCTLFLRKHDIPLPQTIITEDIYKAHRAVQKFGKAIFKPLYTSKARGMEVIHDDSECREKIVNFQNNGNPVMYIQKMIDNLEKDLGIVFIGGKYFTTYARVKSNGSWNTTIRTGGKYESYQPSQDTIELARKAQALFKMAFTCVDVAETADGPKVFEVSAFGGFKGILQANGINAAEHYVQYVLEQLANQPKAIAY